MPQLPVEKFPHPAARIGGCLLVVFRPADRPTISVDCLTRIRERGEPKRRARHTLHSPVLSR